MAGNPSPPPAGIPWIIALASYAKLLSKGEQNDSGGFWWWLELWFS